MSFAVEFAKLADLEGGYVNDPTDRGGATKFGITEKTARSLGFMGQMEHLTLEEAGLMYKKAYWDPLKLDEITADFPEVAAELFATAANQGVQTAGKFLQEAINLVDAGAGKDDLLVDGLIGLGSLGRLASIKGDPLRSRVLLKTLNCLQAERYIEICRRDPTQRRFFRGWLDKRVNP